MKITNININELKSALLALEGLDQAININDKETIIKKPFKFSGKFRAIIARNLRLLNDCIKDMDGARIEIVKEISNGAEEVPKEKLPLFYSKYQEVLNLEVDISLTSFEESDLRLDDNAISHEALSYIFKFLVKEPEEKKEN